MDNQEALIKLTNQINKHLFSSEENRNTELAIDTARAILHLAKKEHIKQVKKEWNLIK
tara:strand:+ start:352 stop:525 length:174 start_codon:yes stop_codon:yes gene_type:complete